MPKIEWNGPNLKYIISWWRADIENAENSKESYQVEDPREYFWVVASGLSTPYTPYNITVKAKNDHGDAPPPIPIMGWSGEDSKFEN